MHQSLLEIVSDRIESRVAPDDTALRVLTLDQGRQIADTTGASLRDVERTALAAGALPERYLRNSRSYTVADQIRLCDARVAVIGLGGLGGAVVEILARAGVGALVLMDGDRFEAHNLNRQLFSDETQLGRSKATVAAQRVSAVNSTVQVTALAEYISDTNAAERLADCRLVIDCLDNVEARFVVARAARQTAIPMVSAAVAGATAHVTTIFPDDLGLEAIHGPYHALKGAKGAETVLGNLPQTVTMAAAMECSEALKVLTGRTDRLLRNKLWIMDLSDNTFEVLSLV